MTRCSSPPKDPPLLPRSSQTDEREPWPSPQATRNTRPCPDAAGIAGMHGGSGTLALRSWRIMRCRTATCRRRLRCARLDGRAGMADSVSASLVPAWRLPRLTRVDAFIAGVAALAVAVAVLDVALVDGRADDFQLPWWALALMFF